VALVRFDFRSDYYPNHRLRFRPARSSKRSSSSRFKVSDNAQASEQPSCQFPKQMAHSGKKVCTIGEIRNYVAIVLRAESF
jgi:hypothetical protein